MFIDQRHSRAVATVMTPDPPVALKEVGALETVDWHFSIVGPTSEARDDVQADAHPKKRRLALAPSATGATRRGLWPGTDPNIADGEYDLD